MSTDYGFYCLDCKDHYIVDNERNGDHIEEIIAIAPKLATLRAKTKDSVEQGNISVELRVCIGWSDATLDLSWFETHGTHRICSIDEYGGRFPRCRREFFRIGPKGEKWPAWCKLLEGHVEPECSEVGVFG